MALLYVLEGSVVVPIVRTALACWGVRIIGEFAKQNDGAGALTTPVLHVLSCEEEKKMEEKEREHKSLPALTDPDDVRLDFGQGSLLWQQDVLVGRGGDGALAGEEHLLDPGPPLIVDDRHGDVFHRAGGAQDAQMHGLTLVPGEDRDVVEVGTCSGHHLLSSVQLELGWCSKKKGRFFSSKFE